MRDGWQVALVRAVKLRRHSRCVSLMSQMPAAASRIVEEGDVAGVSLRIVGTDQTEERTFRPVLSAQSPSLAVHHGPVEAVEDDARHTVCVPCSSSPLPGCDIPGRCRAGRRWPVPSPTCTWAGTGLSVPGRYSAFLGYLRQNLHILHFYHVGDEVGNITALAQYENNLQGLPGKRGLSSSLSWSRVSASSPILERIVH